MRSRCVGILWCAYVKMVIFSAIEKEERMLNISSNEIVLNVMLDKSPSSSSVEVGIAIPPKSVRCVVEQYK